MPNPTKIDLITIGDELLMGIRENKHLFWIGEELSRYGLDIQRNLVVRDSADEIRRHFSDSWLHSDIVITTGGLGPTCDDLTRETIAQALALELEFVPEIKATITERFKQSGRPFTSNNLKQCYRPRGAETLSNPCGTAPGIYLQKQDKILIMLPGPATELEPMWHNEVLPHLQSRGLLDNRSSYLQIRTSGIGESTVEATLQPIFAQNPDLSIAFCAHQNIVDLRLSSSTLSPSQIQAIGEECRQVLGIHFLSYGHSSLAEVVLHQLRALNQTLSLAESCTGGLLSDTLTNVPRASEVFAGGVVCYSDAAKIKTLGVSQKLLEQHGAVSAETAQALAKGAAERFATDYALSITGFAGPSGGDHLPAGTVYIGCHSPTGTLSRQDTYRGDRLAVKARAVTTALDWLRRELNSDYKF